jgi:hypothetical protein
MALGGRKLLELYNGGMYTLLKSVYPQYEWLPWLFASIPNNYFETIENQKKYVEWIGNKLNVKQLSDWYNITREV